MLIFKFFLIGISYVWIYAICCLSVLRDKNSNAGHYTQTLNSFRPAILTGAIDLHHLISLLVALTLVEGHKVSRKEGPMGSFSCILLHFSTDYDEN